MPSCYADPLTKFESSNGNGSSNLRSSSIVRGGFSAPTRIGFNAISFDYTSKVTYSHPKLPVNLSSGTRSLLWRVQTVSESSRIFNSLSSEWLIRVDPDSSKRNNCIVDYQIEMEFSSALYSAVTSQFFDILVKNIDQ